MNNFLKNLLDGLIIGAFVAFLFCIIIPIWAFLTTIFFILYIVVNFIPKIFLGG